MSTLPQIATMQTSRAPVSRCAVTPAARRSSSKPTYVQPADSGVTLSSVPSGAGEAAGETSKFAAHGALR